MARFFVLSSGAERRLRKSVPYAIGPEDFGLLADVRGEAPRMTPDQLRILDELAQSGVVVMSSNRWRQNDAWYFRDRNVGQRIVREQEAQSHRLNHGFGYSESCRHCIAEGKVPEYNRRLVVRAIPIERQQKARLD